jgi:predicted short-subunit dehydrogenase-like oxidoreductase (DUF2520 family)
MGMRSVSIIGVGRVGGALAIALSRAGYLLDYLVHRDGVTAKLILPLLPGTVNAVEWSGDLPVLDSDIVFITTADPDIEPVAVGIRDLLGKGSIVIHTSGSLSSESLSAVANAGHFTASMHPLVSISDAVSGAQNFPNAFFCIEGDETAASAARSIAEALGGRPFSIDSAKKPLYHAAAVTACGHLVALVDIAIEMLSKCGIETKVGKEILLPLISSTVANLETRTPEQALTGSFARLDAGTIANHLSVIDRDMTDQVKEVYVLLGERSLELAMLNDVNAADVQKVRDLISMAKRKSG